MKKLKDQMKYKSCNLQYMGTDKWQKWIPFRGKFHLKSDLFLSSTGC